MGRVKKRVRANFSIIDGILLVFIVMFSYFIYLYHTKYIEEVNVNNTLKDSLEEVKLKYDDSNNKLKDYHAKIENIKSIDENMNTVKEETFSLISQLENKILNKQSDKKIAYLTFDDGPYSLTNKFLDVLDKYNVKATFFTIGADKDRCYDNREMDCSMMYQKIASKGHTIANHTYSHAIHYGLYSSVDSFINNVKKQEDLIYKRTGITTNIVRFPGGSFTAGGLKNGIISKLRENNYGWVDWSASNGDGGYVPNGEVAYSNLMGTINSDIEVVLFHDYSNITLSILPKVIEDLKKDNYILLPLFYDSVAINK